MVVGYIIPIAIVSVVGFSGYLVYNFLIKDIMCNRSVNATLKEFNIKKTQFQIIKEFHASKGEKISDKEISKLQKRYRQHEPDQFLSMYDAIRDKSNTEKKN
ncbi:MAG: hypothetical protein HRO68_05340 [Nitrosopumilus sp.]|nr:hypothetical protein [Nitrosopumilus sp.]